MPRRSRLAIADLPHHVFQRGHNRRSVFLTDGDRVAYLKTLAEFRGALGIKVYAWCLMTNHVHLIVDPGSAPSNLGLLMKRLAGRHTRRVNHREGWTGTAWEGRFKCSPIDTERYLLACTRYVELNPVRAGITRAPAEYPWSSFRAKVGLDAAAWLDLDPCFLALGPTREERQARYRRWIEAAVESSDLDLIRSAVRRNQPTGSEEFECAIEARTGRRVSKRGRGRPRGAEAEPQGTKNRSVPISAENKSVPI